MFSMRVLALVLRCLAKSQSSVMLYMELNHILIETIRFSTKMLNNFGRLSTNNVAHSVHKVFVFILVDIIKIYSDT